MRLSEIRFPLECIVGEEPLQLIDHKEWKEYRDGAVTDKVLGEIFMVGCRSTFSRYSIKVPSSQLGTILTQLKLAEGKGNPIFLKFTDALATPFSKANGEYDLSIMPEGVSLVTNQAE